MQYPFQHSDEEASDALPYAKSPEYPREVISGTDPLFGNFFDPSQPNFQVDMYENRAHGLMQHFTGSMIRSPDSPPPAYNDLFLMNDQRGEQCIPEIPQKPFYVKK